MIVDVGMHADPASGSSRPARAGQLRWDDRDPTPRRLRSSVGTFGPLGRVVATGLVVLFVVWFLFLGPFMFFLVPALPVVLWVLREIWAKAPVDRGPSPTQAPDFSGVRPGRGPSDPVQPSLWTSWEAAPAVRTHVDEDADAVLPDAVPDAVPEAEPEPATEEERLALAHLLDPRLAASLRDRPRAVPPPFPGDAARQRGAAGGSTTGAPA